MRIVVLTSVLTLTLGLPAVTWAQARTAAQPRPDAKPAAKAATTSRATVEQIAGWVKELTSRDFQARRAASRRLVAAGKAVIGKVSEAADGSDLERTTRCLYVLKKLQGSEDKATKAAAGAALKKLAGSKNSTVARRAQAALPKADPKPAARPSTLQGFRIIGLQAANRISVSVVNGQRTIEVKEGTGKILIQDNNGKQIRMEITSRVKGRLQIRKVKAATEEALKKADPEAYKLYKKYTLNNALQIQIQGIRRGALPLPLPGVRPLRRPRPVLPLPRRSVWHQQVEAAQTSVDAAVARLQALAKLPSAKPEQLREVLGELSKAQKVLTALLGPRSLKPKPGGEKSNRSPGNVIRVSFPTSRLLKNLESGVRTQPFPTTKPQRGFIP